MPPRLPIRYNTCESQERLPRSMLTETPLGAAKLHGRLASSCSGRALIQDGVLMGMSPRCSEEDFAHFARSTERRLTQKPKTLISLDGAGKPLSGKKPGLARSNVLNAGLEHISNLNLKRPSTAEINNMPFTSLVGKSQSSKLFSPFRKNNFFEVPDITENLPAGLIVGDQQGKVLNVK